jgi:transposase InsO family protein
VETPEVNGAELELLCVDSGTTHVVTPHASLLSDFHKFGDGQGSINLAAKSSACSALGHGKITLRSRSTGSDLIFHHALYVPNARRTLICLGRSMRDGVFWHFDRHDGGYVEVAGKGFWAYMVLANNNLLFLEADPVIPPCVQSSHMHAPPPHRVQMQNVEFTPAELAHRRFGHMGRSAAEELVKRNLLPPEAALPHPEKCDVCVASKQTRPSRKKQKNPAERPLRRLHVDLMGPITPAGRNKELYAMTVTDEFSGYVDVRSLLRKNDAPAMLIDLLQHYERMLQPLQVCEIFSDQGGEFDNAVLQEWQRVRGIQQLFSPARTPECNGRIEGHNRTVAQTTRALMLDQQIPPDLWPEVAQYGATYLLNRRPRRINGRYVIPYEAFTSRKVNVKHLHIIGSPCRVLIKPKPICKFSERGEPGILLGYVSDGRDTTCVYRVLLRHSGKVVSRSDVHVLEPSRRALQLAAPQSPGVVVPEMPAAVQPQPPTQASIGSPSPSTVAPPAVPVMDRHRGDAGGGGGRSSQGVPPHQQSIHDHATVSVPADASTSPRAHTLSGLGGPAMPAGNKVYRSMRHNRGVPPPRFDGSAAAVTASRWPLLSHANHRPRGSARNYLAEVAAVTGEHEDAFAAAANHIAEEYGEALNMKSDHAPSWQKQAPRTIDEALRRPDASEWRVACNDELSSFKAKGVYNQTDLPEGKVPIGLRWVFSYKLRPDGSIERYKARLVAKGYTQQYGVDYFEVWAPTGRLAAYRALLSHAAYYDLPVEVLDFTTAFLNGPLKEEIYVSQPPGFCDGSTQVWRLQRALYGLKQAANAWHTTFVEELISIGYKASVVDPAIFVRQCRDGVVILHTHVDDCAGTGPPEEVERTTACCYSVLKVVG